MEESNIKVALVKQGSGKYLFKTPMDLVIGDRVICDTCKGEKEGIVLCCADANPDCLLMIMALTGATLPLKSVVGVYHCERFTEISED